MTIIDGQTDAPAYVFNLNSVDPTTGENPNYNIIPLLTVGDEVPYLEGEWGNLTPSETLTYAMAGIPDGLGISKIGDFYYVWMNHEIASPLTSEISSTVEGTINGARVSLYLFDQNWKAIGGKNLIETATADGTVYTWNPETGNYESENGEILNTNDQENFTRFCSGYLAASGFVDENGNSVPIYFVPEETTENAALGEFARSRGWAVTPDGNALALDGLGIYAKEQVFAASQYRADNSDYTVLFSPEDYTNGELYLYVGKQREDNPNGFTNNPENFDLYVLRVEDEQGNIFSYETMPENASLVAKWTLVPDQAALGSQERLSQWVDAQNRSTNFRRLEDLHEDPNNPGTFYFVTTGTNDVVPGTEERDNPFGKLHRFTFALDENGQPQDGAFEFLLKGGQNTGVSYDNVTVDQSGNVLIQEDRTGAGGDIMDEQQRNGRVLSYNIAYNEERVGNDEITFLFELDQTVEGEEFDTGFGNWETSGIVEVPNNLGSYLFDVQAHSIKDSQYVEGGQLILVTPKAESGPIVELVGFASQPADTFADGPSSGNFIGTENRPTPFTSQPVQGFSGVQFANDGNYWFLSDNGFGSKSNSADFLLRIYQVDPDFKTATEGTGETEWTDFIQLSDPNYLVPFDLVNESTSDRLLTGADFDVESFVIADDDTIWVGDEFGPYLLHFDANGVLLDAPIATPNITNLNTLEGQDPLVIGHRGASGELPEHTLESYKRAIEQGADFIEPDLVSTKDGVLIARHEPILAQVELDENGAIKLDDQGKPIVLSATTNIADKAEFAERVKVRMLDGNLIGGWFADDFTLEEIKTLGARQSRSFRPQEFNDLYEIPTLDEVIDLVQQVETETGKKIGIYPETKHPTYFDDLGLSLEEPLVETLLEQGFTDPDRLFIQSFEVANLLDLKNNLLAGTALENTPLVQLYDEFQLQPYDIVANFSDPNFNPTAVYGSNMITATTDYGDLINQDEDNSQNLLSDFVADYASGIGPWKRTFVLAESLDTPVDGNGDGVAEITEQLTGEILPVVEDAHAAGLQVHPYTFRNEEQFLVLKPDGTPQTAEEEYQQFIQLGVDGFFTDFPATGDKVRDQVVADLVRSLSNPDVLAGNAVANLPNSRGFEGMAYSSDRQTLYPLLEGSVIGDPANALRIYEFDVASQTFADDLVGYYGLEKTSNAIGDFTPINDTEFLVIERDNEQGANAQFKKIFKIDISQTDKNGYVEKEELVNLLNISDPNDLNEDGSQRFTFPFQTIENLIVLDETTLLVVNDNNYPFSIGRGSDIDNTEFITLKLSEPLDLDPLLGTPDTEPPEVPSTVYGSPDNDIFDSVFPDEKGFIGNQQILFTGSGNDTVDVTFAGNNRIDLGSGNDTLYAGSNNRILAGSGDDLLFIGSENGNNVITGGAGKDQFWLVTDVQDLPNQANIITDFMAGSDSIGFANTNLDFADLTLNQNGVNTIINALNKDLAVLQNIQVTNLSAADFIFA